MDSKEEILDSLLPCPFCSNAAMITMGLLDPWDGTTKAEYPAYSIRCSGAMGSSDKDAILCSIQPHTGYMHWTVDAAKDEWNTRAENKLIKDALELLHKLCYDRGVILGATCVFDSRNALRDLLNKHNLPNQGSEIALNWTDGDIKVTAITNPIMEEALDELEDEKGLGP